MAAAVETMAYSGEVPWHREGVAVQPDLTPYEMMEAAELDWTVTKRNTWTSAIPMNQYKPDEDGNIALQLLPNPDRFDLVRDSDNSILGSCGSDYQPIQNERIFDFFQKFSKHADITMETAGSLKNGQSIWGLARINDAYELTGGDEMNSFVLFHQPHQPGHSMNIRGTEVRVVCNNTLQMAMRSQAQNEFRMSHRSVFDEVREAEALKTMGVIQEMRTEFKDAVKFLSTKKATEGQVLEFVTRVQQPTLYKEYAEQQRLREEGKKIGEPILLREQFSKYAELTRRSLEESPGAQLKSAKGTWWGALNAVTFIEDHQRGGDNKVYNAMFGDASNRKTKALNLALEYARAA